jgi:Zn-dependent protease with chaperone function
MPILVSLVLIFGFILPSFLLFEPRKPGETITLKLAVVIAIAAFGLFAAAFRVFGSWWRTRRLVAEWTRGAEPIEIEGTSIPAFMIEHEFPVFAVVGLVRPRLFVARHVLATLDENEIAAVVGHERGHIHAHDNVKRLMMRLTSDILVAPVGRSLESVWSEAAESAADEYAVEQGGTPTALHLASALIKIARIIPDRYVPLPNVSFAFETGDALTKRIRRLMQLADGREASIDRTPTVFVAALFLAAVISVLLATDSAILARVHKLSEIVLSVLQ